MKKKPTPFMLCGLGVVLAGLSVWFLRVDLPVWLGIVLVIPAIALIWAGIFFGKRAKKDKQ